MASVLLGKSTASGGGDQVLLINKNKPAEEETRAFLTFSSSTGEDLDGHSSSCSLERGLCSRKHRSKNGGGWCRPFGGNCLSMCLLVLMALLGVSVICLELYRSHEVFSLRSQLEDLRRDVDNLKHRVLEEHLFDELKAFEDAVYAEESSTDDDDDDDDDDEDDVSGSNDDDEDAMDDEYDVDYDVEEDNKMDEDRHKHHSNGASGKSNKNLIPEEMQQHHNKQKTGYSKGDPPKKGEVRAKREISSGSESGLPIISGSYGAHHNKNSSEGLRLYEGLVSGSKGDSRDTTGSWVSTESPIKQHHRVSPLWSSKPHHKKHHYAEQPVFQRQRPLPVTTQTPAPIITRQSRVMETDPELSRNSQQQVLAASKVMFDNIATKPEPLTMPEGEVIVKVYQEHRAAPVATVRASDVGVGGPKLRVRRKKLRPKMAPLEGMDTENLPRPTTRGRLMASAHYSGDTSKYSEKHEHYAGNGRLRHPDGIFSDWMASSWVQQLGMDRHFHLLEDGKVQIKNSGLYYIYAQIYYVDEHDMNGYRMYVNNDAIAQCTVHSGHTRQVVKSNTCHTGTLAFLKEDDKVSLRDIEGNRYSLFEPAKSFFGFMKLGDAKIK